MINLSKAFKRALYYDEREYLAYADITLEDSTVLSLTNEEIWSGGFAVEDAVSEDNSFTALGSTIIGSATLIIDNIDEDYSEYDFTNAKVVLYVGMELTDDDDTTRLEKIKKGTYTVDSASYNDGTITLSLLDNMEQFDRPYSGSVLAYPNTLDAIVRNACTDCGVTLNTYEFPHKDFEIEERPEDEATTYREVIGWAAAIAGCFARCNRDGQLELKWFDQETLESRNDGLDGGSFDSSSPYATGDSADGGDFTYDDTEDSEDAGEFTDESGIQYIHSLYSQDIAMDDVVITGVSIKVKDETEEGTSYTKEFTSGSSGYVIAIENNDFLTPDNAEEVVTWLGTQLIGLTFRKANVTHANDPSIEAGDIGILWDRKDRDYPILITRTNFSIGSPQTTVCGAETPSRNSATRYGWATKSYVESRKMLNKEQTTREQMLEDLANKLASHSGLYSTVEEQETGGNIYYLHDMPTLDESAIVWKMTAEAWGVTTNYDGDNTVWNGGMTVDGDTIVRILEAVGVDADWITTGKLSSKDGTVYIDLDNNEIYLKGVTSFDGYATKSGLATSGYTTINGSNITTGTIQDASSNTVFNLSTGALTIKKGSINIGSGNFEVDTSGNLTAKSATINGTMFCGSSSGYWMRMNSSGQLAGGYGSTQYGYIDYSGSVYDSSAGTTYKGITMSAGEFFIGVNHMDVASTRSGTGSSCATRTVSYVSAVDVGDNISSITVHTSSVKFIHGLMCSW